MRKFIVLTVMLFTAGYAATLWAASAVGGNTGKPVFQSSNGVQSTQADQGQVGEKLKGEGETQSGDHKNLFPKAQLGNKKYSSKAKSLDDKHGPGVKGKFDHKNEVGKKGKFDHKGEMKGQKKGFLKGDKGFLKGQKGFLKGEKGKPNEIDDEVTWGKNEMKGGKMQKGKGFMKLQDTNKQVGGAQMPGAK